jgi:hypothetical protein
VIVEWPHIIEPEDMVRVGVRVDDRVQPLDAGLQHLHSEVRRRIDDDVSRRCLAVRGQCDENRRPQSLVLWIG